MLAITRGVHHCTKCRYYAYHGLPKHQQVRVGNRIHHPACQIVRPIQYNSPALQAAVRRVTTGASIDDAKDAPFIVLGLLGLGMMAVARR